MTVVESGFSRERDLQAGARLAPAESAVRAEAPKGRLKMRFSVAPLLLHSEHVPATVRRALRAAYDVPADQRTPHLESAARILHRDLELDCADARELVGLSSSGACA